MKWTIPGTVLRIDRDNADGVEEMFSSMFLAGGMVLSQGASITGLEPYTVQNWVKRGFLPPPVQKRYSLTQLCRIINIHVSRLLYNSQSRRRACQGADSSHSLVAYLTATINLHNIKRGVDGFLNHLLAFHDEKPLSIPYLLLLKSLHPLYLIV